MTKMQTHNTTFRSVLSEETRMFQSLFMLDYGVRLSIQI